MLRLVAITIFLAAAMLFLLEPLAGKLYLPLLGGSPAVWNTCLMFFQGVLLLAYFYAHRLSRLPLRTQQWVHVSLLLVAAISLPVRTLSTSPSAEHPVWWLLWQLSLAFGPAFLAIAATGTLLQKWFSTTTHPHARDPYFLYAASNAGSAVGLLAYPLVVEPTLTRHEQSWGWAGGYAVLAVATAVCARLTRRAQANELEPVAPLAEPTTVTPAQRRRWVVLALVPSSLMMGVTQHITTDIAAVPLLWVAPLTLYLLSYMVAFGRRARVSASAWGTLLVVPAAAVIFMLLAHLTGELWQIPVHLVTFFIAAAMCHRLLAETRPPRERLTEFYLWIAVGGALGGVFNALVAPHLFTTIVEYPLMLGVACLLRPRAQHAPRRGAILVDSMIAVLIVLAAVIAHRLTHEANLPDGHLKRFIVAVGPTWACLLVLLRKGDTRFGLTALGLLLITPFTGTTTGAILRHRSFFGVTTVIEWAGANRRTLVHGTTNHGQQVRRVPGDPVTTALSQTPTTYYHREGPLGDIIRALRDEGRLGHIVGVGLGAGTIAAYADEHTSIHFIEIDPGVVEIADNPDYFTYLSDARDRGSTITTWVGDGRLGVAAHARPADLIILDAFSSDAIPVHLMTSDAMRVYLDRLAPRGVIAFHISSRTFDLAPVVAAVAAHGGLTAMARNDESPNPAIEKFASYWVAVARAPEDLGTLTIDPNWRPLTSRADDPLWTDDYTNVIRAIDW